MERTVVVVGNARDRTFHVPEHGGRGGSSTRILDDSPSVVTQPSVVARRPHPSCFYLFLDSGKKARGNSQVNDPSMIIPLSLSLVSYMINPFHPIDMLIGV